MVDENPVDLERKAERCLRVAKRTDDQQAVHALHEMAATYRQHAEEARAWALAIRRGFLTRTVSTLGCQGAATSRHDAIGTVAGRRSGGAGNLVLGGKFLICSDWVG
jgi:hypothetical protein